MKPGTELDAKIAAVVFGWYELEFREVKTAYDAEIMGIDPEWEKKHGRSSTGHVPKFPVKKYSRDIAAAWDVVEKLDLLKFFSAMLYRTDSGRWAIGHYSCEDIDADVEGDTASHAICLAALKASENR